MCHKNGIVSELVFIYFSSSSRKKEDVEESSIYYRGSFARNLGFLSRLLFASFLAQLLFPTSFLCSVVHVRRRKKRDARGKSASSHQSIHLSISFSWAVCLSIHPSQPPFSLLKPWALNLSQCCLLLSKKSFVWAHIFFTFWSLFHSHQRQYISEENYVLVSIQYGQFLLFWCACSSFFSGITNGVALLLLFRRRREKCMYVRIWEKKHCPLFFCPCEAKKK